MAASKFTKARRRAIIESLRAGNHPRVAAQVNGVAERTLQEWLQKGRTDGAEPRYRQFVADVEEAEAFAEAESLGKWRASDDWRAHMEYLARKHPERWAKRQNVDVTSKGQPIRTIEVVRTVRAGDDES
jgi:transposase